MRSAHDFCRRSSEGREGALEITASVHRLFSTEILSMGERHASSWPSGSFS